MLSHKCSPRALYHECVYLSFIHKNWWNTSITFIVEWEFSLPPDISLRAYSYGGLFLAQRKTNCNRFGLCNTWKAFQHLELFPRFDSAPIYLPHIVFAQETNWITFSLRKIWEIADKSHALPQIPFLMATLRWCEWEHSELPTIIVMADAGKSPQA